MEGDAEQPSSHCEGFVSSGIVAVDLVGSSSFVSLTLDSLIIRSATLCHDFRKPRESLSECP